MHMRVVGTAATFLTVATLLVACDGRVNHVDASHVDPAVLAAINSAKDDPQRPDSDAEFMLALANEGLIQTPDDFNRVGGYFAPMCMGFAIADDLGTKRPTGQELRKELNDQYHIDLTADQWVRIEPAFTKMCADLIAAPRVSPTPVHDW